MTPLPNEHSRWYHCLCCYPQPETKEIQPSPAGHWDNGKFQEGGQIPAREEFKREFQKK